MATYIDIPCGCGRTLRAKHEWAGSAIRCWDCRTELAVPRPRLGGRLVCEILGGLRHLVDISRFSCFLLVGAMLAGLLLVGRFGPWLVAGVSLCALVLARHSLVWTAKLAREALRSHPMATLACALAVLPALAVIELVVVGFASEQGWFRYVVLDLAPRASAVAALEHRHNAGMIDLASISDSELFRIYTGGLSRGRLLVWTIPASLLNGTAVRLNSGYAYANLFDWQAFVDPSSYLIFRASSTALIGAFVLMLLGLLARWICLIGTVDARYLALVGTVQRRDPRAHVPKIILSPRRVLEAVLG